MYRINGADITPVQPGFKDAANPGKRAVSFDIQIYLGAMTGRHASWVKFLVTLPEVPSEIMLV